MFVCLDSVCGYHDYTSLLCTNLAEVGMAQAINICLFTFHPRITRRLCSRHTTSTTSYRMDLRSSFQDFLY
jgi:hypothetical protein